MATKKIKLYNSARYPTSLLVRGADELGVEIAKSLLEQGGYVIIVDDDSDRTQEMLAPLAEYKLLTIVDYSAISILESELRRLDYVFYFQHKSSNLTQEISSQEFLQFSNYLDTILDLSVKFEAKFLLSTSIKAHQVTIAHHQIDANFDASNYDRHTQYTELEIQRYGETLVKEYQEKVGLDVRIIRLGILLGKPFDPQDKSLLYELIKSALAGNNLTIPGDGLDTDYYVHYLDAAYGIIKAQFALETLGETFSLCNEEQVSLLSISYKLIELIPTANEIAFDSNDHSLPPIQLYKPAKSLSDIGWKPRITFERSLSQTVDVIRNYSNKDYVNKIVANHGDGGGNVDDEIAAVSADALTRLISQRRSQEKSRLGSVILANKNLKDKEKTERNKGLFKKIDNQFNNILFSLRRKFSFMRNMSVFDFISWVLIFIALTIFYFVLFAPAISLIRDVYTMKSSSDKLFLAVKTSGYDNLTNVAEEGMKGVKGAQERLGDLRYIFNIIQRNQDYTTYQKLLENYSQLYEGLDEIVRPMDALQKYVAVFAPKISYRYAENALLSVDSSVEYEDYIADIKVANGIFKTGIDKTKKALIEIGQAYDTLPSLVRDYLKFNIAEANSQVVFLDQLNTIYNYLPTLTGYQQTRNYLIVVQDNSRYTAGGGEICGYIVLSVKNGGIKEIRIRNAGKVGQTQFAISKDAFDSIKLISNTANGQNSIKLQDLSMISNQKLFFKEMEKFVTREEGMNIDISISVNLKFIEELIGLYGNFEFRGSVYTRENLLGKINDAINDDKTYSARNEVILNLAAMGIEKSLNSFKSSFFDLYSVMVALGKEYNVRFYSSDSILASLTNNSPLYADVGFNDYTAFGTNFVQGSVAVDKYPSVTMVGKVNVLSDYSTQKTIELSLLGVDIMQNAYLCMPSGAKNVDVSSVPTDLVSRAFINDKMCYTFLKRSELKYKVAYGTLPFTSIQADNIYKYTIVSNPGLSANYDLEFEFADGLGTVEPVTLGFVKQGKKYIYTGRLQGYETFIFKLIKSDG